MAAAAILDFQICEILLADGDRRDQMHNRCGDITIVRIFKMAAAAVLDF